MIVDEPAGHVKLPLAGAGTTIVDALVILQFTCPQFGEQVPVSSRLTLPPGHPVPEVNDSEQDSITHAPLMHQPPVHVVQSGLGGYVQTPPWQMSYVQGLPSSQLMQIGLLREDGIPWL